MKNRTETEPKVTGRKKHSILRMLRRVFLFLLVLMIISGAAVFLYAQYTKTHYKISYYQEISGKVSGNIRIAVISDIPTGNTEKTMRP